MLWRIASNKESRSTRYEIIRQHFLLVFCDLSSIFNILT